MSELCPVCHSEVSDFKDVSISLLGVHGSYYSCPRCGDYQIESFTATQIKDLRLDPQTMAVLSHWIRTEYESIKKQDRKDPIILTGKLVDDIIGNPRPSLAEQADNYVRWIGDKIEVGGRYAAVERLAIQAIVGSANEQEFELVSHHLTSDTKLIDHGPPETRVWRRVTLSFDGWEHYRELKRETSDSRKAFMAMEYGHPELDGLFKDVLKPAVKQTGFDLFILPERPKAGLIDNRLRVEIQTSRFLVADLTHENAGAYWEAGYAEGLGKPVIYTCEKNKFEMCKTHFDTNHHLTLQWDSNGSTEIAEDLKATIRATLPGEAKLTDD